MNYARGLLSAGTAIFLSLLGIEITILSKGTGNSKAIGVMVLPITTAEVLLLPLFWAIAALVFALLLVAGHLKSKALRILLFWTPVTGTCILGFGMVALFAFLWLHFMQG